jgi:hypothetical protein
MASDQIGVIIETGLADWQIIQQDKNGYGRIALSGRWLPDASGAAGVVEARVVDQNTGIAVSSQTDWQAGDTKPDGTWQITLDRIPAGGLYRIETHLKINQEGEWSVRGDMRHCIGVGDVWIIAGQSNSAGYGRGPYNDSPELGLHLFRNSGQWSLATHPMNDSTDTLHSVNRENANSSHSPYLHFGRVMKSALGYPIGLVQTALGGSPLSRWNPRQHDDPAKADLFTNMVACVQAAGGAAKGVLWYQGESDANDNEAGSYQQRFIDAVQAWRAALNNPVLAVITVQINRVLPRIADEERSHRAWTVVREAQRQVPKTLAGVAVVPALDLPLSDLIHTSAGGNLVLADRMARAALGMVHGREIVYGAPDIESATKSGDGCSVTLTFANVTSRIDSIEQFANPFKLEDAHGDVKIEAIAYPGDATIVLRLGRPIAGDAVVHGAFGYNPPTVPMDMDRVLPMLGFYGVPVSE